MLHRAVGVKSTRSSSLKQMFNTPTIRSFPNPLQRPLLGLCEFAETKIPKFPKAVRGTAGPNRLGPVAQGQVDRRQEQRYAALDRFSGGANARGNRSGESW